MECLDKKLDPIRPVENAAMGKKSEYLLSSGPQTGVDDSRGEKVSHHVIRVGSMKKL